MDKFSLIKSFSREITSTLELEKLASVINSFAVIKLKAAHSSIMLSENEKYSYSTTSRIFNEIEKQTFRYIMKIGKCLKISNPKAEYSLKEIDGIKSFNYFITSIPLATKNRVLGSLNLYFSMPYDDDFLDFLGLFAELSASSIMNSISYKSLGEKSVTDKLTGLYNRTNFDNEVEQQIEKCSESKMPISVMMIDIDDFKQFNDIEGHQEGDRILSSIGSIVKSSLDAKSKAFRYGGEEIAVVVPRMDSEKALSLAEKIREKIESSCKTTVSMGIATCKNSSCSAQTMVSEADKALYRSKKRGKNMVSASLIIDKSIGPIDMHDASEIGKPSH